MRRADGNGGLDNHQRRIKLITPAIKCCGNVLRDGHDMLEIGRAVFVGGRVHTNEDGFHIAIGFLLVGGEAEPSRRHVPRDHVGESRLVNWGLAAAQHIDLLLVDVEADHCVADGGQAAPGDQTDIPGTDHCDFHVAVP